MQQHRRWNLSLLIDVIALASILLLVAVVWLCVRAHFGSNDYLEWRSKELPVPQHPDAAIPVDDPIWAAFAREFEQWDRNRSSFHIRANRNAIFAFGRQPFFGYPRNSFSLHLYYWLLIPGLAILPVLRLAARVRRRTARRRGFAVESTSPSTPSTAPRSSPDPAS